jgi:predicted PhzF superfamily epimerase YddE/YHI9
MYRLGLELIAAVRAEEQQRLDRLRQLSPEAPRGQARDAVDESLVEIGTAESATDRILGVVKIQTGINALVAAVRSEERQTVYSLVDAIAERTDAFGNTTLVVPREAYEQACAALAALKLNA